MFLYDSVAFSPPLNVDFGNRYKHFCIPTHCHMKHCVNVIFKRSLALNISSVWIYTVESQTGVI